jgi:hypothetical protein
MTSIDRNGIISSLWKAFHNYRRQFSDTPRSGGGRVFCLRDSPNFALRILRSFRRVCL